MADLQVGDELSAALHKLAASENLSVEALLNWLVERYRTERVESTESTPSQGWRGEALDSFIGQFDDEVHDLSTSVHQSVTNAIKNKHANSG